MLRIIRIEKYGMGERICHAAGLDVFLGLQGMALIVDSIELDKPFEWRGPKAVLLWESERQLRGWKGPFFRTLTITAAVELLFYFLFQPLPLEEIGFDLSQSFSIIFLFALGMSVISYLIGPYLIRLGEIKYKIDNKGIRVHCSNDRLYSWKYITYCKPIEKYEGGLITLFGRKLFKYKDWIVWWYIYNFVTLMLVLIIGVIFVIVEVLKMFQ